MPGPWCRGFLVSLLLGSIWPSFTHLKQMNGCDSFLYTVNTQAYCKVGVLYWCNNCDLRLNTIPPLMSGVSDDEDWQAC